MGAPPEVGDVLLLLMLLVAAGSSSPRRGVLGMAIFPDSSQTHHAWTEFLIRIKDRVLF